MLAGRGVRTLMVDKSRSGRWKVCGCCLGGLGQAVLRNAGLGHVLEHARPIDRLALAAMGARATVPFHGFVSLAREDMDAAIVSAAEDAGVQTRWNTSATIDSDGTARLKSNESLRARVIIDATGLRGQRTEQDRVARNTRIGLGLTTDTVGCSAGTLTMAVSRGGYVGRVALPDGRVDFAAAVSPHYVRSHGSPAKAVRSIWSHAGLDQREVPEGQWRGTPALTRRRQVQEGRILRVGDAAGYVEPFTGEGMSWALLSGARIAEDALACIERGPAASNWTDTIGALLGRRHARCRIVSRLVRRPSVVAMSARVCTLTPRLSSMGIAAMTGTRGAVA